jgi:hypothetical protein
LQCHAFLHSSSQRLQIGSVFELQLFPRDADDNEADSAIRPAAGPTPLGVSSFDEIPDTKAVDEVVNKLIREAEANDKKEKGAGG